ncbi:CidA/LrgA family protein [Singulisphaera sp. PoT]|uniref:CidA/LrgA family protein n=1 Tax=Singulisphaera sp. PoT TaxID=3411797 RepID=UPI003BF52FE1
MFSAFFPFLTLVLAQLIGEVIARGCRLPVPGTVVGAVVLFAALCVVPGLHAKIATFSHTLLKNMLLFFVPASAGIMAVFGDIAKQGPFLLVLIVVSTWGTALASALAFDALRGGKPGREPSA